MPTWTRRLARRFRALVRREDVDREMDAEMRAHLEMEAEELARTRGLRPDEARRQAAIAFGGADRWAEAHRDARAVRWMIELGEDLRYSARALAHAPAFTLSAALVLALGIGASTAVFSAVDAVLLQRLPYPRDEELVRVYEQNSATNRWTLSAVDVQAIERYGRGFSAVGALRSSQVGVSAGGAAERLNAGYATAGFMAALGVRPAAGRLLARGDEDPASPAVAVTGYEYAVQRFGSPAAAVGRTVTIDGVAHRVVGVLGAGDARLAGRPADVWPVMRRETPARRGPFGLFAIARLRPGVTVDAARRELDGISVRIFPEWQSGFQDRTARLTPYGLRREIVGDAARPLSLFVAAVALVLLIAVANVASLSLVRSMRRWREISLRSVLGASRGRLVRLLVTESLALALAGAALGIGVGWAGLRLLKRFASGIPRLYAAHLDARAVAVALAIALAAGVVIGLVPALRLLTGDAGDGLRGGTRAIGDGRITSRVRAAFVAAEFALALPVLAAGALLLNSVMRLQSVDPGFDPRGVMTMAVGLPSAAYDDDPAAAASFWTRVASGVEQLPGVAGAGYATSTPPNDGGNSNNNFDLVDRPVPPGEAQPTVSWPGVSPGFFTALRLPLLDGRLFTAADTMNGTPVVVVTRSWATRYYPGRSAVGRELVSGGCTECPHTVVVGVVGDLTIDGLGTPREAVFSPLSQGWPTQLNLFVRASGGHAALVQQVRGVVQSADPGAAMGPMTAMEDQVYDSVAQPRHWALILAAFAAAALAMAAVGIFGLLSFAVALRRGEIGVLMALGAPSPRVVRSIVADGMRYAVGGTLVGLVLAVAASRWLRGSLYEVSAFDPPTLLAVTGGLLAVALVAAWLPARRAARISPVEAMRAP
jgi:putative ABC transport system permease protein